MGKLARPARLLMLAAAALLVAAGSPYGGSFEATRIFIEYNSTDNDLGFHVFLDAEEWKEVKIVNPVGRLIMDVEGKAGYAELGLSELSFEGAEPTLDDFPLQDLLAKFPEGRYKFFGVTPDGDRLFGTGRLSHAVPAGPEVSTDLSGGDVVIKWEEVTSTPPGFPNRPIKIVGYQIIVGENFQVTLPASARQVELPDEYVATLAPGTHGFEVLAIDQSGNQTITEGSFDIP